MRITAGKYKNKKLFSPTQEGIRPTMEKAKEALFSILQARLGNFCELNFLDVFAGSGSMGFEALSRGFSSATFIDTNTETLQKNAKLFAEDITILKQDATNLSSANKTFDVVFLDAPYHQGLSKKAYESLQKNGYIQKETIVIIEVAKDENVDIEFADSRNYGINKFLFI